MKVLRLILGDQLNAKHTWFQEVNENITYAMMELRSETDYATHHIQKIIGFFAAMRSFANDLRSSGHNVLYFKLTDKDNLQSFSQNILSLIQKEKFTHFEYLLPDEYRLDTELKELTQQLKIDVSFKDTEHFLSTREDLGKLFEGKKQFLMESFYRMMRKRYHLMMEGEQPLYGKWNFDSDNRKKLPANHAPFPPLLFSNDLEHILQEIVIADVKTIGTVDAKRFLWPITRLQALELLDFFIENCLTLFGTFQDAMANQYWSLYHSRLSFAMNIKLLSPLEIVQAAITKWEKSQDVISYNQLEGFVRQIIGWREYMRGIYWLKMPEYAQLNYFGHQNKLPKWYWTGETKMNCLKNAISQSLNYAYAHHIQRLMVTGNFALLAGVHPDEVDAWYLGIYIDALEWVEITNTRGMSQYADGGIVGSKPYVSSANYIDKMSDHCGACYYKSNVKVGDKACPFNSLYWHFYDQHADKLSKNPRIGMMYVTWNKMKAEDKAQLLQQADAYLSKIDEL
jgi:deoxyribodipyrimidine photolyase-related protein